MFLLQYNFLDFSSINDETRINILISCTFFPYMNLNRKISLIIYNIYNMSYNFCTGKILRIVWLYSILADERSRRWDVNYRVWNSKTPANAFSASEKIWAPKMFKCRRLLVRFFSYLNKSFLSRVTVICNLEFYFIIFYNCKSLFKLYIYQKSPYNHFIYFLHRQKYLYQNWHGAF